ncbi:hypothetical protein B7494_g2403 [Chlorociboria aeruginascens]|nr:hypothetical protein B7494_g2403 [Chlorociboria aeruginascens]
MRIGESARHTVRSRSQHFRQSNGFVTTTAKHERFVERHGKAVEPFLSPDENADGVKVFVSNVEIQEGVENKKKGKSRQEKGDQKNKNEQEDRKVSSSAPLPEGTQAAARIPSDVVFKSTKEGETPEQTSRQQAAADTSSMETLAPLETVLQMPPPESLEEENAAKPPHLQTPPYVHHFDTYTLVQQVEAGGFTMDQSITAMKAVRGLLALNLDVAKKGLVSKSDVENETYLFRAACSELRTEIQNNRKAIDETMRRERTLLQHEVDILNQKLTQELLTLKDDLKGMFDDRKMAVRSEQRSMESAIQELNYKITVLLNSDSKSEVEGLRWVLTRRSVMGILFMAFMVLTSLRYASYRSHEDEVRKKKEDDHLSGNSGNEPCLEIGNWVCESRGLEVWRSGGLEVGEMAEQSPEGFSGFWQRSVGKISNRKVKFMPNMIKPAKNNEEDPESSAAQKQHRRAQVRKAQKEHRQRKENYVKTLEQDIAKLRQMISVTETEVSQFQKENVAIRAVISNYDAKIQTEDLGSLKVSQSPGSHGHLSASITQSPSAPKSLFPQSSASSSSLVNIGFDPVIHANCLQTSPILNVDAVPRIRPVDDLFDFTEPMDGLSSSFSQSMSNLNSNQALGSSKPLPKLPNQISEVNRLGDNSLELGPGNDLATIAINFILALEHPCLKHFHYSPSQLTNTIQSDAETSHDPSGHELMASTYLYSSAPPSMFPPETHSHISHQHSAEQTQQWISPSLQLSNLYSMSLSLPKEDWEITPVQAWFLITSVIDDVGSLLEGQGKEGGKLEKLKEGLGDLVRCFAFGAVMDESSFWRVVNAVLGI